MMIGNQTFLLLKHLPSLSKKCVFVGDEAQQSHPRAGESEDDGGKLPQARPSWPPAGAAGPPTLPSSPPDPSE